MLLFLRYLKRNLFYSQVAMTIISKYKRLPIILLNFYRKLLSDEKSAFNSVPSPVLGHSRQGSASSCVSSISSNSQNQQSEEDGGGTVLVLSLLPFYYMDLGKYCPFDLKLGHFCTQHWPLFTQQATFPLNIFAHTICNFCP